MCPHYKVSGRVDLNNPPSLARVTFDFMSTPTFLHFGRNVCETTILFKGAYI